MCHASSVFWLWCLNNITLRPSKKSFWSQCFSSCCWTVVKKNMTVLLTLSWPYLVRRPWNGAKPSESRLGRSRLDERGKESHPKGFYDEGVCVQRRISVSSNIWRPAEAILKWPQTACLLTMGKHGVCVRASACMCASQTTYKNQIEPIKTIGTGEHAQQDWLCLPILAKWNFLIESRLNTSSPQVTTK